MLTPAGAFDAIDAPRLVEHMVCETSDYNRIGRYERGWGENVTRRPALYTTSSGYTGSRNSSIHSTWQGSSTQGRGRPASSQGSDMPGSGSRSSYL
jgi:hypothetical protein